jgi:hypothetical protein
VLRFVEVREERFQSWRVEGDLELKAGEINILISFDGEFNQILKGMHKSVSLKLFYSQISRNYKLG